MASLLIKTKTGIRPITLDKIRELAEQGKIPENQAIFSKDDGKSWVVLSEVLYPTPLQGQEIDHLEIEEVNSNIRKANEMEQASSTANTQQQSGKSKFGPESKGRPKPSFANMEAEEDDPGFEGIPLRPGEVIQYQADANLFFFSSNPYVKLIMFCIKILMLIVGIRVKGRLAITNQRILFFKTSKILWTLTAASQMEIYLDDIKKVSAGWEASFFIWFRTPVVKIEFRNIDDLCLALPNKELSNIPDILRAIHECSFTATDKH